MTEDLKASRHLCQGSPVVIATNEAELWNHRLRIGATVKVPPVWVLWQMQSESYKQPIQLIWSICKDWESLFNLYFLYIPVQPAWLRHKVGKGLRLSIWERSDIYPKYWSWSRLRSGPIIIVTSGKWSHRGVCNGPPSSHSPRQECTWSSSAGLASHQLKCDVICFGFKSCFFIQVW